MSVLARATATPRAYGVVSCYASSSRSTPRHARPYETEVTHYEAPDKDIEGFGTMTETRRDETTIKRWRGKGIPQLNSLRNRVSLVHPHLYKGYPFRDLTIAKRKTGGRGETGKVVVRHIGGGNKQRIRTLDFFRFIPGIHDVIRLEYDPGRSAHIALVKRRDTNPAPLTENEVSEERRVAWQVMHGVGKERGIFPNEAKDKVLSGWSYIVAPHGIRAGDTIRSFRTGVPQGYVEGWNDFRLTSITKGQAARSATTVQVSNSTGKSKASEVDDDPSSPQTVDSPLIQSDQEIISPRALALFRTEAIQPGNVLPLYLIPPGTQIHNITLEPLAKMRLVRSAGATAELLGHTDLKGDSVGGLEIFNIGGQMRADGTITPNKGWALVKMASGEIRKIVPGACATIGRVSNTQYNQIDLGKAGRSRWLGRRPRVRGVAMNAVDHPMGGGKGKSKGGKESTSICGWTSKGRRTRRPNKRGGNMLVVKERPRGETKKRRNP